MADDLQRRGLHVDLSKGAGTSEKRFVSYDPDLVIKEQFTPVVPLPGVDKESIAKNYTWHKSSTIQLVKAVDVQDLNFSPMP